MVEIQEGHMTGNSPLDGSELSRVDVVDVALLFERYAHAREAQHELSLMTLEDRARRLLDVRDSILSEGEAIAEVLHRECGKPVAEAWLHEVVPTADLASYWCGDGAMDLHPEDPPLDPVTYLGKKARIERVARGVVSLITPWNFPVAIPLRSIFPALLAGNAIVWKPSEFTPRCAKLVADAINTGFGLPVITLVQGGGDLGAAMVPLGDSVVFTGSVATGKKVAQSAAEALVPASLELGGKDAAIVLDDAKVERSARGIVWGAFANSGQNCAGIERVYVLDSIADSLIPELVKATTELRPVLDYGPLTTPAQLRIVIMHVEEAREAGATLHCGGRRPNEDEISSDYQHGNWFLPTILEVNSDEQSATLKACVDETFGPTLVVVRVKDEWKAVELANATRYGLTASIWTKSAERAERVAKRLSVGTVTVNNHGFTGAIPALPWSGEGETGYGVTNSHFALSAFTRPKVLVLDSARTSKELWWHPYTESLTEVAKHLAQIRSRTSPLTKAKAVAGLAKAMTSRWKV